MKIIAAIEADFEHASLGTRSRLNDDLGGESVLRRTLKRVLATGGLAGVHLVARTSQEAAARRAARELPVRIETHDAPDVPWRNYVASGRKWALDGWRGGVGGVTVFDESLNPWVLEALARRESADAVVAVPAAAPLFDPALLETLTGYYVKICEDFRWVFTQSAPGLSAAIYGTPLLSELAKAAHPPGRVMAYRPGDPKRDMVLMPCYFTAEGAVAQASGRCIADTDAAMSRLAAILSECGDPEQTGNYRCPDAAAISRWLSEHRLASEKLPAEVEIELTTQDPLFGSRLRPRGAHLGRSAQMSAGIFERLVDEYARRDDARVVLGGFGDPLMHPDWRAMVARARQAGIWGITIRTPGVHLDSSAIETLLEARVDVLNIPLDASTPETYRKIHGGDHLAAVQENLQRLFALQQQQGRGQPLVICELAKTRENMDELEAFYDTWFSKAGSALVTGPSHYAGQWPDLAVMSMAPPARRPCERIFTRCCVLADGRVTVCDQDYRGLHPLGNLADVSLETLWTGPTMQTLRRGQLEAAYDSLPLPLCQACDEWHRP